MAGRYLVTGAQLGLLKGLLKVNKPDLFERAVEDTLKLINEIIENQFIGNSSNDISEDVTKFQIDEE